MLSAEAIQKIDYELTKYPADKRQAAVSMNFEPDLPQVSTEALESAPVLPNTSSPASELDPCLPDVKMQVEC